MVLDEHPDFFGQAVKEHAEVLGTVGSKLRKPFGELLEVCIKSIQNDGKILFFGNGGSAADAQHLATELTVRFRRDRAPIASLALTTDTSTLTAIGNDLGFQHLFSRQIEALGKVGDVAVAISTSGNSANVIEATKKARLCGLVTVAFTGNDGGQLSDLADLALVVPSANTARIQEMHIMLGQILCGALEQRLGLI